MGNSGFEIQDNKDSRNFMEGIIFREEMTDTEFNDFMMLSLGQAENGETESIDREASKMLSIFK